MTNENRERYVIYSNDFGAPRKITEEHAHLYNLNEVEEAAEYYDGERYAHYYEVSEDDYGHKEYYYITTTNA